MKTNPFLNASQSFRLLNPLSLHSITTKRATLANVRAQRRGSMNNTEAEFAVILEAHKRAGEISRYQFEGITLRWADMRYTPDFIVLYAKIGLLEVKLIEVKGPHIWDRDIVRFKGARAYWPEFTFEMWQKTKAGWHQKM